MKKLNKNNKGFSLVELLVVIAIMVVLVGVVAPTLLRNIEKSRVSRDIQTLDSVAAAVQATLTSEKANAAAPSGVVGLQTIYDAASPNDFQTEFKLNLPSGSGLKLTASEVKGTDVKIYFVNENGAVTVFASKDASPSKANAIKTTDNNTTFSVTR